MVYRPHLIHQFAHIVNDIEKQKNPNVNLEIHALVVLSFNGSEPFYLIDPDFDLLSEKPITIKHRPWITELPSSL
jgi:hypothetical protein